MSPRVRGPCLPWSRALEGAARAKAGLQSPHPLLHLPLTSPGLALTILLFLSVLLCGLFLFVFSLFKFEIWSSWRK